MLIKKYATKLIVSCALLFIFFSSAFLCLAQDKESENGNQVKVGSGQSKSYFLNEELQSIIGEPFYLYYQSKEESQVLNIEEIAYWKTSFTKKNDYQAEIEDPFFCKDKNIGFEACFLTESFSERAHNKLIGKVYIQQDKIEQALTSMKNGFEKDPVEGKLEIDANGKPRILKISENGYQLDVDKNCEKIKKSLIENPQEKYIELVLDTVEPKVKTDQIQELGIKEKIGQGESNFAGSPKNRIHNIGVAASHFNGLMIKPGEEFSFVQNLGEVDGEHGYKPELVIKNNQTIPEFGGGICQVSTTLFRAALNTGLEITARKNHAYPVQYYNPQGTDATVYIPNPDLKFINNTPNNILIQTKIEGTKLYFELYGTSDGRQVEIEGPIVLERTADGKMKTTLFQIVKDGDGNEIRKDEFKSFYDNPAKYHQNETTLTEKPDDWSKKQWKEYQEAHGL